MYNSFTTQEAGRFGLWPADITRARQCCVDKIGHGIFTVMTRCSRHNEFAVFVDDPAFLEKCGAHRADPQDIALSEDVRLHKHIAMLDKYGRYNKHDVISGRSAASIHGLPLIQKPGRRVEVSHPRMTRHSTRLIRHHDSYLLDHVQEWRSHRVTTPAKTVIDIAHRDGLIAGVAAGDAYVDCASPGWQGRLSEVHAVAEVSTPCFSERTLRLVGLVAGLSESPAESKAAVVLWQIGWSDYVQQAEILDITGAFVGRVDFLFKEHRLVVEIDGRSKYTDQQIVYDEKRREDSLRECGYEVVRFSWWDLDDPARVKDRLSTVAHRSTARL